jgi:hypothetical protein
LEATYSRCLVQQPCERQWELQIALWDCQAGDSIEESQHKAAVWRGKQFKKRNEDQNDLWQLFPVRFFEGQTFAALVAH